MRNLPNITLDWAEYYSIVLNQELTSGAESIICTTDKPNTLYKFFVNPATRELIDMPDNKYKKIVAIYQLDLEYSVKVLSTVSAGKYLVGYEMSYNPKNTPFLSLNLPANEIITILERIKHALEYYASKDIVYGDIKGNNILLDLSTGQIEFCDMDNIQIGEYPLDVTGPALTYFLRSYGKTDSIADAYMYNLFTLKRLNFPIQNPRYKQIITMLESGIYPKNFDEKGIDIFESMATPKNFTGEYAIQYIKR